MLDSLMSKGASYLLLVVLFEEIICVVVGDIESLTKTLGDAISSRLLGISNTGYRFHGCYIPMVIDQ